MSSPEAESQAPPTLHLVGAGRAGSTLARGLRICGAVRIGTVCNTSLESARRAVAFIGAGRATAKPEQLGGGMLMIGVPDAAIETVAGRLAATGVRVDTAFHLSGQHDAGALAPLAAAGVATASMHPVVSFARPELALERLAGAWCVLEGHPEAVAALRRAGEALGMHCLEAGRLDKPVYHAATVAASNFVCTLLDLSERVAAGSGLEDARARSLLAHLAGQILANVEAVGPREALTGPIERGDFSACERLADAAGRGMAAADRGAFLALARLTVDLAGRKGSLDVSTRDRLERLFGAREDGS